MEKTPDSAICDDLDWLERCRYWSAPLPARKRIGGAPRRAHKPLVLAGQGIGLRVDQGTLLIKDGFTHCPQVQAVHRFFPRDRNMPSRIIILDGKGHITVDALTWLGDQNVPLARINWQGHLTSLLSGAAGPDYRRIRAQIAAQEDQKTAIRIAVSLVSTKLRNSVETLQGLAPSDRTEKAIEAQRKSIKELRCSPPKTLAGLLGIEGRCALAYFKAWQGLEVRWKGTGRKPIPNDWLKFDTRTSTQSTKPQNRDASHPLNAMLNYAYAVLESRVRLEIVAQGYDPMIGYLHTFSKYRAAFVFDLMEPLRPVVDRVVLDLMRSEAFEPGDFTITKDGVCRLNAQLAKHLVSKFMNTLEGQSWPCLPTSSLRMMPKCRA